MSEKVPPTGFPELLEVQAYPTTTGQTRIEFWFREEKPLNGTTPRSALEVAQGAEGPLARAFAEAGVRTTPVPEGFGSDLGKAFSFAGRGSQGGVFLNDNTGNCAIVVDVPRQDPKTETFLQSMRPKLPERGR